jgi:hypothetical protein
MEASVQTVSSRSIGIRLGSAYAVLAFILFVTLGTQLEGGGAELSPWLTRLVALAAVIYGHRYFKVKGNGFMSYGDGIGIAAWIGVVGSVINGAVTYVYLKFINTGFLAAVRGKAVEEMEKQNQSEESMELATKIMDTFASAEALFIFEIILGMILFLFIGLIVSIFTKNESTTPPF